MNWKRILERNYKDVSDISQLLNLTEGEQQQFGAILERYPMSIPDYYISLINFEDPKDPIRKMCIPSISETDMGGKLDTSGERENTVIAGMQHKYKETLLILSTHQCAMYCRHCFRKRLVGYTDEEVGEYYDQMVEYAKEHKEVSNVLISGGDAFLNSNKRIEEMLEKFTTIGHLVAIRFGTRIPVVFPMRITEDKELLDILSRYNERKQIYVVTQFNHPRELTREAIEAVRCLQKLGIQVKNQIVLLKDVNDTKEVLSNLLRGLIANGIAPYYIFQCRPVQGVKNAFQVPLKKGYGIVEAAKSLQNGLGKSFKYCMSHETGKIEIVGLLNDEQMLFKYNQAKNEADQGRIFVQNIKDDQCWLDHI